MLCMISFPMCLGGALGPKMNGLDIYQRKQEQVLALFMVPYSSILPGQPQRLLTPGNPPAIRRVNQVLTSLHGLCPLA